MGDDPPPTRPSLAWQVPASAARLAMYRRTRSLRLGGEVMSKPDSFSIGWIAGITYVAVTWVAGNFINDFILYIMLCITVGVVFGLIGRWIASRS